MLSDKKTRYPNSSKFSPDDALLTTAEILIEPEYLCWRYYVRVWDVESGMLVRDTITASPAAFLYKRGNKCLVYCSLNGTLEIEEVYSGRRICSHAPAYFDPSSMPAIHNVEISSKGNLIAISYSRKIMEFPSTYCETDMIVFTLHWN